MIITSYPESSIMAALANLPPTLRRKIALAQKYAYCPAALPYLEPITYPWVIVPLGNAQRRVRREIADRIDAVNFIREYIQDGHWPPPGLPGEWGPQPVDPQDFPGPYFEPAEWVLAPEDPTKRSRRWDLEEEVEPHGDATEEASNLIHPPKQPESNYESKKARRRSQDNWDRNSISSSLKTEYLPPDWVFKDSLPDSWKQNPNSARAEADDPPVNSVKPRESLGNSQDDRRSEPNSEQPQAESPLETIVCESQEDDSAPLQDAQDTRDTFRILVGDEDVDALTLLTDPSQHQAEGSQHSFHTVSTLPLPPEEQNRLHLRGGEPVSHCHLFFRKCKKLVVGFRAWANIALPSQTLRSPVLFIHSPKPLLSIPFGRIPQGILSAKAARLYVTTLITRRRWMNKPPSLYPAQPRPGLITWISAKQTNQMLFVSCRLDLQLRTKLLSWWLRPRRSTYSRRSGPSRIRNT